MKGEKLGNSNNNDSNKRMMNTAISRWERHWYYNLALLSAVGRVRRFGLEAQWCHRFPRVVYAVQCVTGVSQGE